MRAAAIAAVDGSATYHPATQTSRCSPTQFPIPYGSTPPNAFMDEGTFAAREIHRRRTASLARTAFASPHGMEVPSTATDRSLYRRFRLHGTTPHRRGGRLTTSGSMPLRRFAGCIPWQARLRGDAILGQRGFDADRGSARANSHDIALATTLTPALSRRRGRGGFVTSSSRSSSIEGFLSRNSMPESGDSANGTEKVAAATAQCPPLSAFGSSCRSVS